MPLRAHNVALATAAALLSAALRVVTAVPTLPGSLNTDYITPPFTFSPDHRFGIMVPVFHIEAEAAQEPDDRRNKVVELRTHRIVAVIQSEPGYDRALNFHETATPRWSADSSLLLWKVNGKWSPDALVLLKVEQNRAKWQLDLLKTAQQAVLARTQEAAPDQYEICKKANSVLNGRKYPAGFTIDVTTDGEKLRRLDRRSEKEFDRLMNKNNEAKLTQKEQTRLEELIHQLQEITFYNTRTIALPLEVHADLSSNPKEIENFPTLTSHLDAVVTSHGQFAVKGFHLGSSQQP